MATVERRRQGKGPVVYRVRWRAEGQQRSKTFVKESEAKRFKALLEGDLANGSFVDPKQGQLTVREYAESWFKTVVDVRATTHAALRTIVYFHLLPEFGHLPLAAVTHDHVARWIADPRIGVSTRRKCLFTIRRLLQAAVNDGRLKHNVAVGVRPPAENDREQRFLSQQEANRLVLATAPRVQVMVLVAIYGGLRFGELCALRRRDIDLAKGTVRVRETLVDVGGAVQFGPPKTKNSLRTVTLPRSVTEQLRQHLESYTEDTPDALVFTGSKGQPIRRAWFRGTYWLPATKAAGLEGLRFHDTRHTFVALWVSLGRNAKEVSTVAGHSSVAFTLDRYGHLYASDDEGLGDALDALLRGLA